MKNFLWLFFFALLFHSAIAQGNAEEVIALPKQAVKRGELSKSTVLAFYPGFWNPGIKLERVATNSTASFGFHTRGYLFLFNGIRTEPFTRIYFKKKAPEGAFAQFKISAGFYDRNSFLFRGLYCYSTSSGIYLCPGDPGYIKTSDFSVLVGGGVSFGYQFLLGNQGRFALDLFGGVQAIIPVNRRRNNWDDLTLWLLRGFPLELGIRLGKAF